MAIGYLRGRKHRDWVQRSRLYNVRAGDRPGAQGVGSSVLAADIVCLYGGGDDVLLFRAGGSVEAKMPGDLAQLDYPREPKGVYFCLELGKVLPVPAWLTADLARRTADRLGDRPGTPVACSWADLQRAAGQRRTTETAPTS